MLTANDLLKLLNVLHPGFGYSKDKELRALQVKLSIMLQAAREREGQTA